MSGMGKGVKKDTKMRIRAFPVSHTHHKSSKLSLSGPVCLKSAVGFPEAFINSVSNFLTEKWILCHFFYFDIPTWQHVAHLYCWQICLSIIFFSVKVKFQPDKSTNSIQVKCSVYIPNLIIVISFIVTVHRRNRKWCVTGPMFYWFQLSILIVTHDPNMASYKV